LLAASRKMRADLQGCIDGMHMSYRYERYMHYIGNADNVKISAMPILAVFVAAAAIKTGPGPL
jgi:hypothetical protein